MSAVFKSHILSRDEKGVFGVPFKRWLLAGVGGGLTYTLLNLFRFSATVPAVAIVVFALLILTGLRGGIPLWQRWMFRIRGWLLLLALRSPQSVIGQLVTALELPVELVQLQGEVIFATPDIDSNIDLREWITYAHAREQDGLVFIESPLEEVNHG